MIKQYEQGAEAFEAERDEMIVEALTLYPPIAQA
jgi:hypothetical protein